MIFDAISFKINIIFFKIFIVNIVYLFLFYVHQRVVLWKKSYVLFFLILQLFFVLCLRYVKRVLKWMIFAFVKIQACRFFVVSCINLKIHIKRRIFSLLVTYSEIFLPVFMIELFKIITKLLSLFNIMLDLRSIICLLFGIFTFGIFYWTLLFSFPSLRAAVTNTLQFIFYLHFL